MSDLVLTYNGKSVVVLTEDEITKNTANALMESGYMVDRLIEAGEELAVLEDCAIPQVIMRKANRKP